MNFNRHPFLESGLVLSLPVWDESRYQVRPMAHPTIHVPVTPDFWHAWHAEPGHTAPQIEHALRVMMPFLMRLAVVGQSLATFQTKLSPADIVTEVDLGLEGLFRMWISRHFPEDQIIGEEGGYTQTAVSDGISAPSVWIIDPIDGTSNYAAGSADVVIQLCRLKAGIPDVAVMGFPFYACLETASVGGPTWEISRDWQPAIPPEFRIATEYREDRNQEALMFLDICHLFGGQAYRLKSIGVTLYCLSGQDHFVFYKPRIKIWDIYPPLALFRLRNLDIQMQLGISVPATEGTVWVDPFSPQAYVRLWKALSQEGRIGHILVTSNEGKENGVTLALKEKLSCISLF